jgi:hypothetical protein
MPSSKQRMSEVGNNILLFDPSVHSTPGCRASISYFPLQPILTEVDQLLPFHFRLHLTSKRVNDFL